MSPISIPGYTIERELGVGGMARVYLALQCSLERRVALKVMAPALAADPNFSKRFLREARTIAALTHPHIVALYEVGVTDDHLHYFSMQYLPGGDFAQRMRRGVEARELVRVLTGIAKALGFAHQQGVVHRDVTPGNIMFDGADTPLLTDFGIARALSGSTRITSTGVSIGTSNYMSPEQARGADVDARSDLYSLGALAFEALVGRPPYNGPDGFAVAYAHVFEPIPRLPAELKHWQPFIDRALAKDPKDRFQSAEEMADALAKAPDAASATALARVESPSAPAAILRSGTQAMAAVARRLDAIGDGSPAGRAWLRPALLGIVVLGMAAALYGVFGRSAGDRLDSAELPAPQPAQEAAPVAMLPTADPVTQSVPSDPALQLAAPAGLEGGEDPSGEGFDPLLLPDASEYGPVSVSEQIRMLLEWGQALLRSQRLMLPAEANATLAFSRVLALEPGNTAARDGLVGVVDAYLVLADQELDAGRIAEGRERLDRARQVAATPGLDGDDLRRRIDARWSLRVEALRERAREALARWQGSEAEAAISQALAYEPEDPSLKAMLREAKVIGKPGYVFRDGADVPEMIIAGTGKVSLSGTRRGGDVQVSITQPFAVSRREISVADFRRFIDASGHAMGRESCGNRERMLSGSRERNWRTPGFTQADTHPVVCVSHQDAEAYVAWLSKGTGQRYRLLSEAEWQFLASKADVKPCETGNRADQSFRRDQGGSGNLACDDGHAATAPVGSYQPTPPGIYDLEGNVREWVADCGNDTHVGRGTDQTARLTGRCDERIIMGSAWHSTQAEPALLDRRSEKRNWLSNTTGFRIARDLALGTNR